jgi:AcrR family transcriptional regulator
MVGVKAKDHDDKRQMILEKAAELFGQQGFHKTSIQEISAACNGSKAWVYHYYKAKEAILFHLVYDFLGILRERTAEAVEAETTPRRRLRAFIREYIRTLLEYRINYSVIFNDTRFLSAAEQKRIRSREREHVAQLRDILIQLSGRLESKPDQVMPTTFLVLGTISWTYTWFDPKGPLSLEQLVDLAERLIIDGLASV